MLTIKRLLFGVAFLFALLPALAGQYPDHAQSTQRAVFVRVVWLPTINAVNHMCSKLMGRDPDSDGTIVGCYNPATKTIYAAEPRSFNDHFRLEILGHEFWHALGAEHP
jgi:hypothetical protein